MFELDHLVFATPHIETTTDWFAEHAGVEPTPGGQHVGFGTRNTLIGLGGASYLEIIGPDVEQEQPATPRPFGIDELDEPALVTWAVAASDLDRQVARCRAAGVDIGEAVSMSRAKPDGSLLEWSLTVSEKPPGLLPFLIDWRGAPSPAASLTHPIELVEFSAESPDTTALGLALDAIGVNGVVEFSISVGERERLRAALATPNGLLELSG